MAKLFVLVEALPCAMKLFTDPERFGWGKKAASFNATGSKRLTGIWFFGKGALAIGSVRVMGLPKASVALEKSPLSISGVGVMPRCVLPLMNRNVSQLTMKKVRFRPS